VTTSARATGVTNVEGGWPRTRRSKYQPLVDHLTGRAEREVTLLFAEIETAIGRSLPVSTQVGTSQWRQIVRAWAWQESGWYARLDRCNRCVTFTRDAEEQ